MAGIVPAAPVSQPHPPAAAAIVDDDLRAVIDDPLVLDERDDGDILVAALPTAAFVRTARRLREEGRLDLLLPRASVDQLIGLIDLDAWDGDRVAVDRARRWLVAIGDAWAAADKPRGALTHLMHEMDPEFWTLALFENTRIIVLDLDDDASRQIALEELSALRVWESPDGFFVIGVPDDETGLSALRVLSRIYDDDLGDGRRLVMSILSALPSEIEETLLGFRGGRLADLGFVEWREALRLFRPLDHRVAVDAVARDFRWLGNDETAAAPTVFRGHELISRVMARLSDAEHGVRSREFLLLVNEVIAATRRPPGDDAVAERAIAQTQATIGLGLELLLQARPGHPDPDSFLMERVTAIGLRDVFRVGYGALEKLRRAAITLHRAMRVSMTHVGSLLDRPWGPTLNGLCRLYPEIALDSTASGTRPLTSLVDVARATERVAEAGSLAAITYLDAGYGVDPVWIDRVDIPEKLVIGDLLRTAIVHAQLPGAVSRFAPLTADDLEWARENLLTGGGLADSITRDFAARCDALGLGRHTQALADNVLTRLRVELLGLEGEGRPDLTRVGGLITIQSVSMWMTVEGGRN